jgi:hypothetical protein
MYREITRAIEKSNISLARQVCGKCERSRAWNRHHRLSELLTAVKTTDVQRLFSRDTYRPRSTFYQELTTPSQYSLYGLLALYQA